ncbi:MAG: molybdenum cofactor biosynthesis protein MoaE [Gammaproteobacteria bacterium]|nr:molybdenum cofactor biosynthesis protein MoaE [Gammaproteobacteria bacterium]
MQVQIRAEPFDPHAEMGRYQAGLQSRGAMGAAASFIGMLRDHNEGAAVREMQLEHYPGMTEKHLLDICSAAMSRWPLIDCLVLHRTGRIRIGETIVLVATWAAHRGDAMDACRFIIEDLKLRAPFWKKERLEGSERWVEKNTSGYSL